MATRSKIAKGQKVPPKEKKEKSTRAKRYTQFETDLLCDLVLASDINTMVTNKITPYGRMRGWEDIARIFNATPDVTVSCLSFICVFSFSLFSSQCMLNAHYVFLSFSLSATHGSRIARTLLQHKKRPEKTGQSPPGYGLGDRWRCRFSKCHQKMYGVVPTDQVSHAVFRNGAAVNDGLFLHRQRRSDYLCDERSRKNGKRADNWREWERECRGWCKREEQ